MLETPSTTYKPSPFENLQQYIRLNNSFYEVIEKPQTTLSLTNIFAVTFLGALTLGTTFSLTAKDWWKSRLCKIAPLNIIPKHICVCLDAFAKHEAQTSNCVAKELKAHRGWQIIARQSTDTRLVDSLVTHFFDKLWHESNSTLDDIWQKIWSAEDIQEMLHEQQTLDCLRLKKDPHKRPALIERLKLIFHGHSLELNSVHRNVKVSSISNLISHHSLRDEQALIFTGQSGSCEDHHLLCLFSHEDRFYLFNPYEGIFELCPSQNHSLEHLFDAYAQLQFQESPCESISMLVIRKT